MNVVYSPGVNVLSKQCVVGVGRLKPLLLPATSVARATTLFSISVDTRMSAPVEYQRNAIRYPHVLFSHTQF